MNGQILNFRANLQERESIEQQRKALGLTLSEFLRLKALYGILPSKTPILPTTQITTPTLCKSCLKKKRLGHQVPKNCKQCANTDKQ